MPLIVGTSVCDIDEEEVARLIEAARLSGPVPSPEVRCMAVPCRKKDNLRKCAGCQSVLYCSVECQRHDWSHHKTQCSALQRVRAISAPKGYLLWDRNFRHWEERFRITLEKAFCYGLDLYNDRSNLDKFGMVVIVEPRTHGDPAARFLLKEVRVLPLDDIFEHLTKTGCCKNADLIIDMWKAQRELIPPERKSQVDYGLQVLEVDSDAFRRFTDGRCPRPNLKLIMTRILWHTIANSPQGEDARKWVQDLYSEIMLNLPVLMSDG